MESNSPPTLVTASPVHLCIGQEAIAVGVCRSMLKKDLVLSSHRSHGHYLAKGGDLKTMLAEIYGKSTGCSRRVEKFEG